MGLKIFKMRYANWRRDISDSEIWGKIKSMRSLYFDWISLSRWQRICVFSVARPKFQERDIRVLTGKQAALSCQATTPCSPHFGSHSQLLHLIWHHQRWAQNTLLNQLTQHANFFFFKNLDSKQCLRTVKPLF